MNSKKAIGAEPVYKEIGARLRWLRQQKGLSLAQFVRPLAIHPSSMAAWENALARPGVAELIRVCHALGVELAVLLAELPLELCYPDPQLAARRKAKAFKRLSTMAKNGTTTRNTSRKAQKQKQKQKQKG